MEKKELLKKSITDIVVEHENSLHNCEDFVELITSQVLLGMEEAFPDIMDKIKSSDKKVGVAFSSTGKSESWNKFNQRLSVPREHILFENRYAGPLGKYDKELTLYEMLSLEVKSMIVPLVLQNFSFLVDIDRIPFAEYCVQRIDDSDFISQISNLVYAKHLFDTPKEKQTVRSIDTNDFPSELLNYLKELYILETENAFDLTYWAKVREEIGQIFRNSIHENAEPFRQSVQNAELSIFAVISRIFNEKRQEMGLPTYTLQYDNITSYTTLLKRIEREILSLKQLETYASGKHYFVPFKNGVSNNGFFYGNGEFVRIEKRQDSLIETIKENIRDKKIYDGSGRVIASSREAFSYYGWNNDPIYETQPITTRIVSANNQYLQNAYLALAKTVVAQYAKVEEDPIITQTDLNTGGNTK